MKGEWIRKRSSKQNKALGLGRKVKKKKLRAPESSVRGKKVIFTGERGENMADYLAVNQPNMPEQQATVCPCVSVCVCG